MFMSDVYLGMERKSRRKWASISVLKKKKKKKKTLEIQIQAYLSHSNSIFGLRQISKEWYLHAVDLNIFYS